jgi:hypothetical protein
MGEKNNMFLPDGLITPKTSCQSIEMRQPFRISEIQGMIDAVIFCRGSNQEKNGR